MSLTLILDQVLAIGDCHINHVRALLRRMLLVVPADHGEGIIGEDVDRQPLTDRALSPGSGFVCRPA